MAQAFYICKRLNGPIGVYHSFGRERERLSNGDMVEVRWRNKTITKHRVRVTHVDESDGYGPGIGGDNEWTVTTATIDIKHNGTKITTDVEGLPIRMITRKRQPRKFIPKWPLDK